MATAGLTVLGCCGSTTTESAAPQIRSARPADLDAVLALVGASALPIEGIAQNFGEAYAVAEAAGRIVGVAGIEVHGNDALLRSVAVDEAYRGRGLGIQLTLDRIHWARSQKVNEVYLLTTTAADFFSGLGFELIARDAASSAVKKSEEFKTICSSTAAVMKLSLAAGEDIRAVVRGKYASAALAAQRSERSACCGDSKARPWGPITSNLYETGETQGLPAEALLASLGCGNPTALAQLSAGETVLDLGSGGGIDVLLSARRVGPTGKAYGLDMTDEMLALARENQAKAGATNVEFLKGEIEHIPLPDDSVDVIISNCVINLSADKAQVLREAFRVLKPGGRFAVSDIVVRGEMPDAIRRNVELWTGCVAGALEENEYKQLLIAAGFADADIEATRVYGKADIDSLATDAGLAVDDATAGQLDAKFISAFVRARKPN